MLVGKTPPSLSSLGARGGAEQWGRRRDQHHRQGQRPSSTVVGKQRPSWERSTCLALTQPRILPPANLGMGQDGALPGEGEDGNSTKDSVSVMPASVCCTCYCDLHSLFSGANIPCHRVSCPVPTTVCPSHCPWVSWSHRRVLAPSPVIPARRTRGEEGCPPPLLGVRWETDLPRTCPRQRGSPKHSLRMQEGQGAWHGCVPADKVLPEDG